MLDQASALRHLMQPADAIRRTRVIAVSSGKGGVGKTSVSVNLAIALAQQGLRVVLLDGDLGLANVDVLLGIVPKRTLQQVISGELQLADVLTPAPGGIWVIPGASGLEELANLSDERRRFLVTSLAQLDGQADVLLIDTAAGVSHEVSSFVAAAPETIVVTTPEPTAITDAYALIKVAARGRGARTYRLLVNQANDVGEANEVARKITTVAREFLDVSLELLGYVPSDPYVGRAVRRQVPIMLAYPSSPASRRFVDLARRLAAARRDVTESPSTIMAFLQQLAGVR